MAVSRQFQPLLENKLYQLWHQGYVVFERWELLGWYDRDRITNVVWRDISELWKAWCEGKPDPLIVIKCDDSASPQKYVVINKEEACNLDEWVAG